MKIVLFALVLILSLSIPASSQLAKLAWTAATDDVTPANALVYEVRSAADPIIDTLTTTEANGIVVRPYAPEVDATVTVAAPLYFNVIVKDAAGNKAVYKMIGPITIPPVITTQPANVTVFEGQQATFTVMASGGTLRYRWTRNGYLVTGAASAAYTTPILKRSDNNKWFNVTVSNDSGAVMSRTAVLTVKKR